MKSFHKKTKKFSEIVEKYWDYTHETIPLFS